MIGISLSDVLSLTLEEFNILYGEWDKYQTAQFRTRWEQTRFIAYCNIMPNLKNKMNIEELIPFDWEKKEKGSVKVTTNKDFERIKKMFGN